MSLLPLQGEAHPSPNEPRVLSLDSDAAAEVFDILTATTTRKVLSAVHEQPMTPTEIRDEIGTSLQNVHYHLQKLENTGLIESSGVSYSEKGTEMVLYAPTYEAIVLVAGREFTYQQLKEFFR